MRKQKAGDRRQTFAEAENGKRETKSLPPQLILLIFNF